MDIYSDPGTEGVVDVDKVRKALGNQAAVTSDDLRRQYDREMSIAVMLDIATSLRVLARESSQAMLDGGVVFNSDFDPIPGSVDNGNGSFTSPGHDDFLVVGDVVALRGDETHGVFGEIVNVGVSEDDYFAEVDTYDGGRQRVWLKDLDRLHGDAGTEPDPLAEVVIDAPINDPEPVDVAQGIAADIDEDFDGDAHTAAEDAVAKLAEAEAKRKAEKKGKAKK